MKNKFIRITKNDLIDIVSNSTKSILREYWSSREELINKLNSSNINELVCHWCGLRYCQIAGFYPEYYEHWKTEVISFILPISFIVLNCNGKAKAVEQVLIRDRNLLDIQTIDKIQEQEKFWEVHNIYDNKNIRESQIAFIEDLPLIIQQMSMEIRVANPKERRNLVKEKLREFINEQF